MPNAFISSGVSLEPASAAGGADVLPPENSRMATNSTSKATGIISHLSKPLLRMAGLLAVLGFRFRLRQVRSRVEAVDRRQQRLREAASACHQVQDGRVLGRPAGAERFVLEGGGEEIALQHARVERDPAAAAVGQTHGGDPLVFQDRKSVVMGKSVYGVVELGGWRKVKKK